MCLVVENGNGSVTSDKVNLTDEDTDSDNEGDDEKEEHPAGKYNDQKRYSVAGASVADSVQAGAAEKKEPKRQSQVVVDSATLWSLHVLYSFQLLMFWRN